MLGSLRREEREIKSSPILAPHAPSAYGRSTVLCCLLLDFDELTRAIARRAQFGDKYVAVRIAPDAVRHA